MLLSFKWLNHSSKFKPPPWLDDLHGENRVSPFVYHPTLYHGISGAFISMIDLFNIFQTCDLVIFYSYAKLSAKKWADARKTNNGDLNSL